MWRVREKNESPGQLPSTWKNVTALYEGGGDCGINRIW